MFDLKRIPEIEKAPECFRLLERIPYAAEDAFPIQLSESVGDEIKLALLDVETTGFTAGTHEIIEIGIVQIAYSPSARKITAILEITSQFEQPTKAPISELITDITGITNEMVAGKRIDDAHIARLLNSSSAVVAHNAAFDRGFIDLRFPDLSDRLWACSIKDINWLALGYESNKLEYLLLKNGYFYDGHRAATDCLAMVQLFESVPNALHELLQAAQQLSVKILAKGVAYDDREIVKKRGYRWDAEKKYWWTVIPDSDYDEEKIWLDNLCGGGKLKNEFVVIKPNERHSRNA